MKYFSCKWMMSILALLTLQWTGYANAAPEQMHQFNADAVTCTFGDKGGNGKVASSAEKTPDQRNCVKFDFDFGNTNSTADVFTGINIPMPFIDKELSSFHYYVNGDLGGNNLCVQVQDGKATWHIFCQTAVGAPRNGWQKYNVDLTQKAVAHWGGGSSKGKLSFPLKNVRLQIQFGGSQKARKGTVFFSELKTVATNVDAQMPNHKYEALAPAPEVKRPVSPEIPHSYFDLNKNGKPMMMVNNLPFLVLGAQCDVWRGAIRDRKTVDFFDAYQEMNATAVGIDILWSQLEQKKDQYDFAYLDWYMRHAEARGLKLVLQLYFSNVCGKVHEKGEYPIYTPLYILNNPAVYTRAKPHIGEPPQLCPNNPALLEREIKMAQKLAEYLKKNDTKRTVIMVQLDNEVGGLYISEDICDCSNCTRMKKESALENSQFTNYSFARYMRKVADAFNAVYDIPMYLNSPSWNGQVTEIMLMNSPNLDLIGIDARYKSPFEWNSMSTDYLKQRNLAFRAEFPTEFPFTKANLHIGIYDMLLKQNGIGCLLWECGEPNTVVYDAPVRKLFGEALYPLKHAMVPLAEAFGSNNASGYYCDDRGRNMFYVQEDKKVRMVQGPEFDFKTGDWNFRIKDSLAGFILRDTPDTAVMVTAQGVFSLDASREVIKAEVGRFEGRNWICDAPFPLEKHDARYHFTVKPKQLIRLYRSVPAQAGIAAPPAAFLELEVNNNNDLAEESPADAKVRITALNDLPKTRLRLVVPKGWTTNPAGCEIPSLKKGEKTETSLSFTPAMDENGKTRFRIEAKLENGDNLVAQGGKIIQTGVPFEFKSVRRKFLVGNDNRVTVVFSVINRKPEELKGRVVYESPALEKPVKVDFVLPRAAWSSVPTVLQLIPGRKNNITGVVTIGDQTCRIRPEVVAPAFSLDACTWRFKMDSDKKGDAENWQKPDLNDSDWQETKVPSYWLKAGIHSPKGAKIPFSGNGWYRTSFVIPETYKGRTLYLRIGAIDDLDTVWLNGKMIGQTTGNVPEAWRVERFYAIPEDTIKYDQQNILTVKVINALGDGGIWRGPVDIMMK